MRLAKSLVPTLREDPADAEALSHKLMLRAGLVRQLGAGIYVYLPIGHRVHDRIVAIIREEMNAIGGQEITMPVIQPAEIWQKSGRWDGIPEMFKLKDRWGRDMVLGMTHEEVIAWLAAREIRSYRDLPQIWYQIQTKERDEARPRSGVLRTREFVMKDSYTLDPDVAALDRSYAAHEGAYRKIFERCGLRFHVAHSDTGMMGGLGAHEFLAPCAAGEDEIALCAGCGYAANVEIARGVPAMPVFPAATRDEVATPNVRTIAQLSELLKIDPRLTIKSLLYSTPAGFVLALVRGDHAIHERKLARVVGGDPRAAHPEEIVQQLGAPAGSVGPVGARVTIIADEALREGTYVVGANREGFHLRGVVPGRDFEARFADLHAVAAGEACVQCGRPLVVEKVIEVGNIFKLGTKYSEALGAMYLDESGKEQPVVMGSYGIGPARIAAAAIEQNADADGIVWPASIAPFQVHIVVVSLRDAGQVAAAEEIYAACRAAGFEALLDDRDERPGVKFKDADLLGMPVRVTIGNALAKEGVVEIKERRAPRRESRVPKDQVVDTLRSLEVLRQPR
ncbi:MAG TPA: proline--tRNA ligase [Candidatus Acidoferrum sp.]|jgi:prolyl-tRNA synthetase|nr:proline--tRNA ligase [Candidatus Acidoferrum sp.]